MNIDWNSLEIEILTILDSLKDYIDKSSTESVEHYIKYGEFEMAFEILLLAIMNKYPSLPFIDYERCYEFCKILRLDEESVYDLEFWNNFINFLDVNKLR